MDTRTLEQLMEQARRDASREGDFFRALLDARIYAHVPVSDDHPRLRLIMFRHPDGFMAIPLFTSLEQAQRAAGNAARVVQASGRELLEGTAGATFMINPNDGGAVLYPEEVASLLETGALAHVQSTRVEDGMGVYAFAPHDVPAWLSRLLWKTLKEMGLVEAAYLVKMNWVEQEDGAALLIALGVEESNAERACRALATALQTHDLDSLHVPVDITTFDPAGPLPEFLSGSEAKRVYSTRSESI